MGNTYNGASLTVTNGLVLNGTAYVGNPSNNNYGGDQLCRHADVEWQRDGGIWQQRLLLP